LIQGYISQFIANLRHDAENGLVTDLIDNINFLIFDLISDLAFGESFESLKSRQIHPWMRTFFKSFKESEYMGIMAFNPILSPLLIVLGGPMRKAHMEQFFYTRGKVAKRLASQTERPDFMSAVLKNSNNDGKGLSRPELDSTFNVLMVAGSETTATTLIGCLYLLGTNPDALRELRQVLYGEIKSIEDITLFKVIPMKVSRDRSNVEKVAKLPYLTAAIQETLRLYPPVPSALPRYTPESGAAIAGHWVPGGVRHLI
jgi:cytochrome P450